MSKKLSKIKNLFLVEEETNEDIDILTDENIIGLESDKEEQFSELLSNIKDIYEETNPNLNTKECLDKSVFKIEEILNALPSSLTTEMKKESVLGMMNISQITLDDINKDAIERLKALEQYYTKYSSSNKENIKCLNKEIEDKLKSIEDIKKTIYEKELLEEKQKEMISSEIVRIKEVLLFISTNEDKEVK